MGSSSGGPPHLPKLGIETNFLLGQGKRAVIDAALGTRPYAEQPEALRNLVSQDMWNGLTRSERLHLTAIYNKLQEYHLWEHVTKVNGVHEKAEAPTRVLGMRADVPGSSGGFAFETSDPRALYEGLFSANFGTDGGAAGAMHQGQASTRESTSGSVTRELAAPNGLHVSVGPGNHFDAHVDRVSPTNPAQAGRTEMDLERGWLHHRDELHGDLTRDAFRAAADYVADKTKLEVPFVDLDLAGLTGGPTLEQPRVAKPEDRNDPTAPLMVDITLRGPK
jgi:hypothetical protein